MSILVLGTCRVQDATSQLHSADEAIDYLRHRTHTAEQAEWLMKGFIDDNRILRGVEHTISDRSVRFIRDGMLNKVRGEIRRLGGKSFNGYVIEISSKKNFYCPDGNNRMRIVNTLFTRDCPVGTDFIDDLVKKGELIDIDASKMVQTHSTTEELINTMRKIKKMVRWRPILWVGPIGLVESEKAISGLHENRKSLTDILKKGAEVLSDQFFDPTDLVRIFGEKSIFAADGTDFDHYSSFGVELVKKRIEIFHDSLLSENEELPIKEKLVPLSSTPFFLGTCRTHEPAIKMRILGVKARLMPSRVHSLMQIFQMVKFLNGESIYSPINIHLLSDYAMGRIVKDGFTPEQVYEEMVGYRQLWDISDIVFIEISTLKEFFIQRNDRNFYLNTFTCRDIEEHAKILEKLYDSGKLTHILTEQILEKTISKRELRQMMHKIHSLVPNKKIVWLSHIRPSNQDETLQKVVETRRILAQNQFETAKELGDKFYDPIVVIEQLGDKVFFRDDGNDINHISELGEESLAKEYIKIINEMKNTK